MPGNLSGLAGLNLSELKGILRGGGGGFVVTCDQACVDALLLSQAENMVVPKPHETPAITQAQLDARRRAKEAEITATLAQNTAVKDRTYYESKEAALREKLSGAGGPPGGGPPKPTGVGCFAGEPQPTSDAASYEELSTAMKVS